jgi:hypothetical protein
MTTKITIGIIAATTLMLALSSVVANQVWAAFPNSGKGHETTGSSGASDNDKDGGCSGNSAGKGCAEDIHAGKSDNVKVEGTCCGGNG